MKMKRSRVSVLGVEHVVLMRDSKEDPALSDQDGYYDSSTHEIVVDTMEDDSPNMKKNIGKYRDAVIRHELIHAFLHESGLDVCSTNEWAKNEEMVDWIAIQLPKIVAACKELGVL